MWIMHEQIEDIAKTLKAARQAKGLSQRELGERVGLPQTHISKIEQGATNIRLATLLEIARALDLELELIPRELTAYTRAFLRGAKRSLYGTQKPMYSVDEEPDDG
jgi:HTH-type transcriptional regulator/antitoxin HipB